MRFHTFEAAKQRLITSCRATFTTTRQSMSVDIDDDTIDDDTLEKIMELSLATAQKKTNQEILKVIITEKTRPAVRAAGKHYSKVSVEQDLGICSALSEYEWFQLDRPFYNVYPVVEKLVHNTKLQVSAAFLRLPYRTMLFKFAEGHEPYGIKTILLTVGHPHEIPESANLFNSDGHDILRGVAATATVQFTNKLPDGSYHAIYTLAAVFEVITDPKFKPYEPRFPLGPGLENQYTEIANKYQALQSPDDTKLNAEHVVQRGFYRRPYNDNDLSLEENVECCLKSIEVTIADQHRSELFGGDDTTNPTYMGNQSTEIHQFIFKLATLISMLHRGDNLIEPIVLAKHQTRYDKETSDAARRWLEDKAAQIQGRGFSVGKELQQRSDISPHFRNPHMALYWTGPGRKEPTLIFRAGADVMLKKIARVPTGFMGAERLDEFVPETREEYVYFLREPHTGFVKIGRTRQTINARKRQLECGVHGLILVAHIVTGNCVELETRLHREYAAKRRRRPDGRQSEFFELTDTEVKNIVSNYGGTFHLEV